MNQLKIYYTSDAVREMYKTAGIQTSGSSGFDLMCVKETVFVPEQRFQLIDLGVVIKLPVGYHAILMPRSSTFKKYNILQSNSIGLLDEDYCGIEDVWKFAAYWAGDDGIQVIKPGTRIAQFFIQKREEFEVSLFSPDRKSRGGFGSTGV